MVIYVCLAQVLRFCSNLKHRICVCAHIMCTFSGRGSFSPLKSEVVWSSRPPSTAQVYLHRQQPFGPVQSLVDFPNLTYALMRPHNTVLDKIGQHSHEVMWSFELTTSSDLTTYLAMCLIYILRALAETPNKRDPQSRPFSSGIVVSDPNLL